MKIHFDTNILISLTQAGSSAFLLVEREIPKRTPFQCSAISWAEFMTGPCKAEELSLALQILDEEIIPFTQEDAEVASRLYNDAGRKRGTKLDCMIAATAISHQASLATYNRKDFEKFIPYGLQLQPLPTHSDVH